MRSKAAFHMAKSWMGCSMCSVVVMRSTLGMPGVWAHPRFLGFPLPHKSGHAAVEEDPPVGLPRSATAAVERLCERDVDERTRLIGLRYRTTVNRWTSLTGAASLAQATGGDLGQSLVWREMLRHYDVGDIATVVFRDGFGLWGWVDLWRSAEAPPFSAGEIRYLTECAGPVIRALRRAQARNFVPPAERARPTDAPDGVAVLMLSEGLDVLAQTPPTTEYLRLLVPPAAGRSPIPAGAFNVAAQLLAVEAGVDSHPA